MARPAASTASIRPSPTPAVRRANKVTGDIVFTTPRFATNGDLLTPAYATVILNGVVLQNHQAFRGATNWRVPGHYTTHDAQMPLALQYHNNSVAFRNIWVRPVPQDNEP